MEVVIFGTRSNEDRNFKFLSYMSVGADFGWWYAKFITHQRGAWTVYCLSSRHESRLRIRPGRQRLNL